MQIKDLARDELGTPGWNAYNLIFDMNTQLRVHNQKSASIQRKMATLVCNCGAGCLYFPDDPILRLVCCCADCRTCLALLDAAAGHLPRAAAPIDAVYYPNRLRVERAPTSARAFFCQQQVRRFVSSQGVNPSLHPSPPSLAPSCTDTYTAGAVTPHCPCLHSLTHSLTHTQTHTTGAATPQCSLLSHAYTQTRTHTCTIIHTHAHTHTHTHTLVTHTRTHTRTHTVCLSTTPTQHARTHTHTHCAHTHTHTLQVLPYSNVRRKFLVSFEEYRLFNRALLQNRPIILKRWPQLPPKASCRLQPAHSHWTHPPPPCLRSAHFRARHDSQAAQVHTQWEFLKSRSRVLCYGKFRSKLPIEKLSTNKTWPLRVYTPIAPVRNRPKSFHMGWLQLVGSLKL